MRSTPLARTLSAAALALVLVACGDDGGDDTAAFCDRLAAVDDTSSSEELTPEALAELESLAEDAPDEVRDSLEHFADIGRQLADAGDDPSAQLDVLAGLDPEEAEAASTELGTYAREECDLELDLSDGVEVVPPDDGAGDEGTTEPESTEPDASEPETTEAAADDVTRTGEEPAPGDVDPCSLLTEDEVAEVFAGTIDPELSAVASYPAPEGVLASCQWTSGGGVSVAVRIGPTGTIVVDADETTPLADVADEEGWTEVDGLGQGAWFDGDSTVAAVLYVAVDDDVAMEVTAPAEADDVQSRLEDAADAALGRL
jgi:hypothetical protein